MEEINIEPSEKKDNEEPVQATPELSLKEINEKKDFWWKEIDKGITLDIYKEAWKQYDYYMDLKNKLLTKTK